MGAITDLWKSERGLLALAILVSATVLEGIGHLTSDQWIELVKWVAAFYVGGKTLSSIAETVTRSKSEPPADHLDELREELADAQDKMQGAVLKGP